MAAFERRQLPEPAYWPKVGAWAVVASVGREGTAQPDRVIAAVQRGIQVLEPVH